MFAYSTSDDVRNLYKYYIIISFIVIIIIIIVVVTVFVFVVAQCFHYTIFMYIER